jgi:hypothetical protein
VAATEQSRSGFADEDWCGAYYELAIELSQRPDNSRLTTALETLWSRPIVAHAQAPRLTLKEDGEVHAVDAEFVHSMYGELSLPESLQVGFRAVAAREQGGSDWLALCIPSGMLDRIGYAPGDPVAEAFFAALDHTLVGLADAICADAPFDLALVGDEVSGLLHASDFSVKPEAAEWYLRRGGVLVRPSLLFTLQTRVVAESRPSGLLWIPPAPRAAVAV